MQELKNKKRPEIVAAIAEANIKHMTGGDVLKGDRYMEAGESSESLARYS